MPTVYMKLAVDHTANFMGNFCINNTEGICFLPQWLQTEVPRVVFLVLLQPDVQGSCCEWAEPSSVLVLHWECHV